jgi:hypothetical protein
MKPMRLPFLKPAASSEPLILAMSGLRLGDTMVFSGRSAAHLLPLAGRTGLSGRSVIVGPPEVTAPLEAAATREGVLVETSPVPPADRSFDLAVVEAVGDWAAAAATMKLAVRAGGRALVVAGEPRGGLLARLSARPSPVPGGDIIEALTREGWSRARVIGERDGLLFVEAFA